MDLPIFPLNGAVLFPGTSLPLNIFEKRYIEMVNYALARERKIGMIQTDSKSNLYKIGCVGKIHSFNETSDGRYLISLQGTNCFQIKKELDQMFSFRLVDVSILNNYDEEIIFTDDQKKTIITKYKKYIKIKNINLDLKEIEKIEFNQIVKFIAMVSPFKDIDKQVLLETQNQKDFYNKLLSIIELELVGDFSNNTIN
tara:strand:- start:1322 stop:1915 length:594 start_codon:yes stop_codon:yes gene_type:complete